MTNPASIPRALVRLSYETACLSDRDEFGYMGATVGDVRAAMVGCHGLFDWKPIDSAPRDGSTFLVFSKESATYDFAEYDAKEDEFIKHGCGWHWATHWADMEVASDGNP